MNNKLYIAGLLLLLFALPLTAQQTAESSLRVEQIEPLPLDHFIVGTGSGNSTLERTAANIAVVAQNGIAATDVQAALEELQGEIIGGGDGWGADVVNTSNEFTGDGTSGDPLTLAPGNINTSELNNDAGFLTTEVDGSTSNELQTIAVDNVADPTATLSDAGGTVQFVGGTNVTVTGSGTNTVTFAADDEHATSAAFSGVGTKTLTIERQNGADLTANFTDEVNDADANATNEIQALSISNGVITLDLGGGNVEVFDPYSTETFQPTSGSTVTLAATPNVTATHYVLVERNGLKQTVAFSGSATDVTVSGTTLTFNYRNFEAGELVRVRYIQQ